MKNYILVFLFAFILAFSHINVQAAPNSSLDSRVFGKWSDGDKKDPLQFYFKPNGECELTAGGQTVLCPYKTQKGQIIIDAGDEKQRYSYKITGEKRLVIDGIVMIPKGKQVQARQIDPMLLGTWIAKQQGEIFSLSFKPNGSCIVGVNKNSQAGSYNAASGKFTITIANPGEKKFCETTGYKIKGDQLHLEDGTVLKRKY